MDLHEFLREDATKDLLRLVIVGSVDDGKSTLVGRLLHDCQAVYEDQLDAVRRTTERHRNVDAEIDYSLFTDGLKAEREQGITIDVAYRYFATHRRKFILADTPGHEQYTRNMATGASTAEAALILIDARLGVLPQSRRHGSIAHLLGIRHLTVAVNKMDLVGYSQDVFERVRNEYTEFFRQLSGTAPAFIPVSALKGENIVCRSTNMPWYEGPTLLEHLERLPAGDAPQAAGLRFPIQGVLRPNLDFRGFMGTVASGTIRRGEEVVALPSLRRSRVRRLVTYDGDLEQASASQAVTVVLEDEMDLSRGDLLARPDDLPASRERLEALVVWFDDQPCRRGGSYFVRHTTRTAPARIAAVSSRTDIQTFEAKPADELRMNDIGRVVLDLQRPVFVDPYNRNRATGSFVLISRETNMTAAAGMVLPSPGGGDEEEGGSRPVTRREREALLRQSGAVLWLSGLPEPALAPLARRLERRLVSSGFLAYVVSPEEFGWSCPFAFHQKLNATGIAHLACNAAALAGVLADAGLIAILPLSTLSLDERRSARRASPPGRFVEVVFERGTDRPAPVIRARDRASAAVKLSADEPEQALDALAQSLQQGQFFRPWDSSEFEI